MLKKFDPFNQEVEQHPRAKPRSFYGDIVVVASFLIMGAMLGSAHTFGVFFKPVLTEFGWTRAMTSGAYSLSVIVSGLLGIVMGGLTDRFGPRIVVSLCGFLLGVGYLLMSQISALWQLYVFFGVIIGTGMGGTWVPLMGTVARWFVKRRNMMTGIVAAGEGAGTLIFVPVASWLISIFDWRMSYIIMGSMVLVIVVLSAQLLRRDPTHVGQRPYGVSEGEESGLKLDTGVFSLRQAVHAKQFWLAFIMYFSLGFCVLTLIVHLVPHATDLGISSTNAANILATMGGASIVGRLVLGSVADSIGIRSVFLVAFIMMSAVLFWLALATGTWILLIFAVIFGFSNGGCSALVSPLIAELFGLRSHGLIFGVTELGFAIGGVIGPIVAGHIFDVTSSYQLAFLISAALGIIGLISTALLTPTKKD